MRYIDPVGVPGNGWENRRTGRNCRNLDNTCEGGDKTATQFFRFRVEKVEDEGEKLIPSRSPSLSPPE